VKLSKLSLESFTLEDGTNTLSQNVSIKPPDAATQKTEDFISTAVEAKEHTSYGDA
jgi:hypothetical protein